MGGYVGIRSFSDPFPFSDLRGLERFRDFALLSSPHTELYISILPINNLRISRAMFSASTSLLLPFLFTYLIIGHDFIYLRISQFSEL